MTIKGPWSRGEVERFLAETQVPIRLACNGSAAHPVLASLWYLPEEGRLWCATQRAASVATLLARDPHCAFEVAKDSPPYRGVRGQGIARLHDGRGAEILQALIERYQIDSQSHLAKWLIGRADRETAIEIEPQTFVSWDYRQRMQETR